MRNVRTRDFAVFTMTSGGFVIVERIFLSLTVNNILYSLPSNYLKDLHLNVEPEIQILNCMYILFMHTSESTYLLSNRFTNMMMS